MRWQGPFPQSVHSLITSRMLWMLRHATKPVHVNRLPFMLPIETTAIKQFILIGYIPKKLCWACFSVFIHFLFSPGFLLLTFHTLEQLTSESVLNCYVNKHDSFPTADLSSPVMIEGLSHMLQFRKATTKTKAFLSQSSRQENQESFLPVNSSWHNAEEAYYFVHESQMIKIDRN